MAFYFISCDNELDLVADKREVPVVYAIIDQADTAQYVRVERIFVDKNVSGNEIAKNPDSLYYDDITVLLVRESNGREYELERVDGNLEGYVREDGVFANTPNYLYKILTDDIALVENENYELRIEGIFEDRAVTSTTTILEPPFLLNPKEDGMVNFENSKNINIGWTPKGDAQIYTIAFHFNITETRLGQPTDKRLTWIVSSNTDKSMIQELGSNFFSFMAGALEVDEEVTRSFNSAEFELISGSSAIADYIRVGQANLGITSSGEVPVLTNLSEGLGIFGATHTHSRRGIGLTQVTRDSLIDGSVTRDLNFQ